MPLLSAKSSATSSASVFISPLNPGQCVQIEYPEEGLAVLTLNPPHRKLTVLDQPLLEDLKQAIQEIESKNAIEGVIVKGKTAKIFAAGADIEGILNITKKSNAYKIVNDVHQIYFKGRNFTPNSKISLE